MSWTLDDKFRIHARLSNTSYMHLYSRTSVSLRRLYIVQFLSLHFKDEDEDVLSKGSKDILHYNKYFHAPWNYQMTLLVSFWFLFCFVFIWDVSVTCFNQKCPKSFCSYDKNKLFSYDIIRGIQQAISIFFSFLWGINEGIKRKHILHSLVADQSTGFLARSRVPPQRRNSREIG